MLIAMTSNVALAILGFVMLGLGSAVHFPLMITAAAKLGVRPVANAVSTVILLSGLTMMVTPGIMGWIAEGWGLRVGFATLALPFLVSLVLAKSVVR